MRADRWLGYSCATAAPDRLETLYASPGKQRMPNLFADRPDEQRQVGGHREFRQLHALTSNSYHEQMPC